MIAPETAIDLAALRRSLGTLRLDLSNEKSCQGDLAEHLPGLLPVGCPVEREARLSARDVPDFIVGDGIVIELKVKGAPRAAITRQLERYARHDRVTALILLSNVAMSLPGSIGGKPAFFVSLGGAWL